MGQVINGLWTTAPARVSAKLYALPEQDNDRLYLMPRVLQPRRSDEQGTPQGSKASGRGAVVRFDRLSSA